MQTLSFASVKHLLSKQVYEITLLAIDIDNIAYQIIVADAADAISVNFSGRCKFLQI